MSEILRYWQAGGPIMAPLALLCFATWYWVLALGGRLRRARTSVRGLGDALHGQPPARLPSAAREWARYRQGPVTRVVSFAASPPLDVSGIRGRCHEARAAEIPRFSRELEWLRAMVATAPLLGLLGTVRGMVSTFSVISSEGTSSASLLSAGIAEALVTTQVGLLVALPGLAGAYAISRGIAGLETALDVVESHLRTGLDDAGVTARLRTGEATP